MKKISKWLVCDNAAPAHLAKARMERKVKTQKKTLFFQKVAEILKL